MPALRGVLKDVNNPPIGNTLDGDHADGVEVLSVRDAVAFDEDGGKLRIGDEVIEYTGIDDDNNLIYLAGSTDSSWDDGTDVIRWPLVREKKAQIQIAGQGTVEVAVTAVWYPIVAAIIRDPDQQAIVTLRQVGANYRIEDVWGVQSLIDGGDIDPDTLPSGGTDGGEVTLPGGNTLSELIFGGPPDFWYFGGADDRLFPDGDETYYYDNIYYNESTLVSGYIDAPTGMVDSATYPEGNVMQPAWIIPPYVQDMKITIENAVAYGLAADTLSSIAGAIVRFGYTRNDPAEPPDDEETGYPTFNQWDAFSLNKYYPNSYYLNRNWDGSGDDGVPSSSATLPYDSFAQVVVIIEANFWFGDMTPYAPSTSGVQLTGVKMEQV